MNALMQNGKEQTEGNLKPFVIICALFTVLNIYGIVTESYWVHTIPFVLLILFLVFFQLENALLLLSFLVPLSVNFEDVGMGLGISLPDEPIIMMIMLLMFFRILIKPEYDIRVLKHPITIIIIINTLWYIVTTFSSAIPLVSAKFVFSRIWYITVFYFLGVMLFQKMKNIQAYIWLHIAGLAIVIVYTLIKHQASGFSKDASYEVMQPFYIAHGVYAAAIAFFLPFLFVAFFFSTSFKYAAYIKWVALVLLVLFFNGLVYSYTRAAWLSVVGMLGFSVPILLRFRLNTILLFVVIMGALFTLFQNDIYYLMSKTQDVSSNDMSVHLKSIANVKSDASNAERINRWMSAWNMFKERPVLGFGPGTYMFVYAPYQQFNYQTIISTNFGNVGNAHSEYLGALSETGLLGLFTLLLLIYWVCNTAIKLFQSSEQPQVKWISLSIMLGLITYFIHAVMNNYMESDKIAVLCWGGFAMITALDIYHNESK